MSYFRMLLDLMSVILTTSFNTVIIGTPKHTSHIISGYLRLLFVFHPKRILTNLKFSRILQADTGIVTLLTLSSTIGKPARRGGTKQTVNKNPAATAFKLPPPGGLQQSELTRGPNTHLNSSIKVPW